MEDIDVYWVKEPLDAPINPKLGLGLGVIPMHIFVIDHLIVEDNVGKLVGEEIDLRNDAVTD